MPGELPAKMSIYNIFIVSKSGGLIYHYDHNVPLCETEKTFSYPLDIKLEMEHKRIAVTFGERDGIRIGHSLLAVNGNTIVVVNGKAVLENDQDGKGVFEVVKDIILIPARCNCCSVCCSLHRSFKIRKVTH